MKTLALIFSLVALALFSGCKRERYAGEWKDQCIQQLRQIDGAKEQWALENKKNTGDPVTPSVIDGYIKGGAPTCPAGGKYQYNPIGTNPTCSNPGHEL